MIYEYNMVTSLLKIDTKKIKINQFYYKKMTYNYCKIYYIVNNEYIIS